MYIYIYHLLRIYSMNLFEFRHGKIESMKIMMSILRHKLTNSYIYF